jgi:diguanylate cyclase (GGDEF)-like protein
MSMESMLLKERHGGWNVAAFGLVLVVGVIDYITGPEISFSLFYLVPVAVAAWLSGHRIAIAASLFAAIVWLIAEVASDRFHPNLFVYSWNFGSRFLLLLLVALLLARLRQMLVDERLLSRTDPLTGALNARAFREAAEIEIARSERHGLPLSLAFIDIDDFKRVNDVRGHEAGDRLLHDFVAVVRKNLRRTDVLARYGGDEFVVLLPMAGEDVAREAIEKIRKKVQEAMSCDGRPIGISVGVITCPRSAASVEALVASADRLMYAVKAANKNGVRYAVE